jgi:hypothetical protein
MNAGMTKSMKKIPVSAAIVPEASDYVAHFCGVACYDKWRKQPGSPVTRALTD